MFFHSIQVQFPAPTWRQLTMCNFRCPPLASMGSSHTSGTFVGRMSKYIKYNKIIRERVPSELEKRFSGLGAGLRFYWGQANVLAKETSLWSRGLTLNHTNERDAIIMSFVLTDDFRILNQIVKRYSLPIALLYSNIKYSDDILKSLKKIVFKEKKKRQRILF